MQGTGGGAGNQHFKDLNGLSAQKLEAYYQRMKELSEEMKVAGAEYSPMSNPFTLYYGGLQNWCYTAHRKEA